MNEQLEREWHIRRRAWQQYMEQGRDAPPGEAAVEREVVDSWRRSALTVAPERGCAPVPDERGAALAWQESPLEFAARGLLPELGALARQADLMIGIGDVAGRLLWTAGSERMRALARTLNFVPGGCWDEGSVGTNALALALRERRPVQVFGAEHFVVAVHDWVCYSSPIRDVGTGALVGVLNLSTTWDRHTPLGMTGALHYVGRIEQGLRAPGAPDGLTLKLCGTPQVTWGGQSLHLTPRQHELLAVLALCDDGLSLDSLHAHLYGDQPVSLSTLKAEVSTLRSLLRGRIASRPYRLTLDVHFDAQSIEALLLRGEVGRALDRYDGPLLPASESPLLGHWRGYLHAALREAAVLSRDPDLIWAFASRFGDPESLDLLAELLPPADPRLPLARARRAALDDAF